MADRFSPPSASARSERGSEPVERKGRGREKARRGGGRLRRRSSGGWNPRGLPPRVRLGAGGKPLALLSRDDGQVLSGCLVHGFLSGGASWLPSQSGEPLANPHHRAVGLPLRLCSQGARKPTCFTVFKPHAYGEECIKAGKSLHVRNIKRPTFLRACGLYRRTALPSSSHYTFPIKLGSLIPKLAPNNYLASFVPRTQTFLSTESYHSLYASPSDL